MTATKKAHQQLECGEKYSQNNMGMAMVKIKCHHQSNKKRIRKNNNERFPIMALYIRAHYQSSKAFCF